MPARSIGWSIVRTSASSGQRCSRSIQDGRTAVTDPVQTGAGTVACGDQTCSAQAWFARGERVAYDPLAC